MSASCDQIAGEVGTGVGAALRAVDCVSSELTASAFSRLFAPGGELVAVLTIVLTLFVALFAIALLLGRSNLNIRALTPRMITLGLVLTFATSWMAYQGVVWNLATGAPDQLATILAGTDGSATQTFASKIDVVFLAIKEATQGSEDFAAFSPPGMLWLGAMLFLLGTVGVLVTARIALAVLVAIGPIFVVMALFNGTRGLFTGWLKGLVMLAVTPILVVLGGSIMLELAVPILQALTAAPGIIDPQAAMAFFLVGAVHVALMALVLKVAGTMVAGWSVFGLATNAGSSRSGSEHQGGWQTPALSPAPTGPPSPVAERTITAAPAAPQNAANDGGHGSSPARTSMIRAEIAPQSQAQPARAAPSRASGIGSRFRSANTSRLETFS